MTSAVSVAVDLAWAFGFLVLVLFLVGQLRRMRRPDGPHEELDEPVLSPDISTSDPTLARREALRCPACTRRFDVLIEPADPPASLSCPSCGLTLPYVRSQEPAPPRAAWGAQVAAARQPGLSPFPPPAPRGADADAGAGNSTPPWQDPGLGDLRAGVPADPWSPEALLAGRKRGAGEGSQP